MRHEHPRAILLCDLAYGDCGKGTIVDFLARRGDVHTVVRFNGGPQAGHNVVTADGRHHTFSQFGSGTFVPGVRTLLSRFVLVEPYALLNEARHLAAVGVADALERLHVDRRCAVITPAHQAANRLREAARGAGAHGTCGLGIGETMQDDLDVPELTLRAAELADERAVRRKLGAVVERKREQLRDVLATVGAGDAAARVLLDPSWIDTAVGRCAEVARRAAPVDERAVAAMLRMPGAAVFEPAQGVLLDEWFGFHPHTTWSTTTFANAEAVLAEAGHAGPRARLGVVRAYFTRHGAGPLVTEDAALSARLPEPHNGDGGWQGRFRVGAFDAVAARYALAVAGAVDGLAVTHLDRVRDLPARLCTAYEYRGERVSELRMRRPADLAYQERLTGVLRECRPVYDAVPEGSAEGFCRAIERELGAAVVLTSHGATAGEKRVRGAGVV
jgi:adenylosuccinate synthase